jgi:hypothetical protein
MRILSKPIKDIECHCGGKITNELICSKCGTQITELSCPNCNKTTIFKPINWKLIPEPGDEILEILTLDKQEEVLATWSGDRETETITKTRDWPWGYHNENKLEFGCLLLTYKRLIWVVWEEDRNSWHVGSSIPLEDIYDTSTDVSVDKHILINTFSEDYRFNLKSWKDNFQQLISNESFSPFIQEARKMRVPSAKRRTSSKKNVWLRGRSVPCSKKTKNNR